MSKEAASTEVAVVQSTVNLPILTNTDEVMEIMRENLDGIIPSFDRIKVPSGGGSAFEVPTEYGETEPMKDITGVIIDRHAMNAYWRDQYSGAKNPPDCSSQDGKTGLAPDGAPVPWAGGTNECAKCPLNQYGTADDGNGKACKNMHRIALLREGNIFPVLITVPPTSARPLMLYMTGLTNNMRRSIGVVTKIKLVKEKSAGGIEYSKMAFSREKDLSKGEVEALKNYAEKMKRVIRNVAIDTVEVTEAEEII